MVTIVNRSNGLVHIKDINVMIEFNNFIAIEDELYARSRDICRLLRQFRPPISVHFDEVQTGSGRLVGKAQTFAHLPFAGQFKRGDMYVVETNLPNYPNGLYVVREQDGVRFWDLFTKLDTIIDSSEVQNTSTIPGQTVTNILETVKDGIYGSGSVDGSYAIQRQITLTEQDILNKFITLERRPKDGIVEFDVIGGVHQTVNQDFIIDMTAKRIVWAGFPMEEILSAGDIIEISYTALPG